MTYPEFREAILHALEEILPQGISVKPLETEKLNSCLRYGICFTKEEVPYSPTIYLEPFYRAFQKGRDIAALARELLRCYEEDTGEVPPGILNIQQYESAKENVFAKLIHIKENVRLLEEVPHITFLDFAIVAYFEIDSGEMFKGTVLLKHQHTKDWNITEEKLLQWALQNTYDKKGVLFRNMAQVLERYLSKEDEEIYSRAQNGMYVLTNDTKYLGAVLVYFPEVLHRIWEVLKESYFLLPASVHEWIIVPGSEIEDSGFLRCIVRDINDTELLKEEVLSDEIYFYDADSQKIHIYESTKDK